MYSWKILPISQRVLILLVLLFIINMISNGWLISLCGLVPALVMQRYEIWRLLTYPFIVENISGMIGVIFTFYVIVPELEAILSSGRLFRNSLIFLGLHGILYTLVLHDMSTLVSGPGALSLALIAVFVYMYPSWEYPLFGRFNIPMWILAGLIGTFALLLPIINNLHNPPLLFRTLAHEGVGALSGLIFAHFYFNKYTFSHLFRKETSVPETRIYRTSYMQNAPVRKPSVREGYQQHMSEQSVSGQDTLDENRLNDILDKISEQGHNSLSAEEQQFLKDYAQRL